MTNGCWTLRRQLSNRNYLLAGYDDGVVLADTGGADGRPISII